MQREYHKPRVGISACLLGEQVRYDGGHKRDAWLVDVLGRDVDWVAVCPEAEAGFGTPREPIELVRGADNTIRLMTVDSGRDLTEPMRRFIDRRLGELEGERLCGYVLKAGSPSCGLDDVPFRTGLFAQALLARFPDLPIEDEQRLADPERRRRFVERVFAYHHRISATRSFEITRVRGDAHEKTTDLAAAEEPLEIRLHGRPFATIMRTPGADRELAAGFLLSERIIGSLDDIGTIQHCSDRGADGGPQQGPTPHDALTPRQNVINVTMVDESRLTRVLGARRQTTASASCGVCGRETIESLTADIAPIRSTLSVNGAEVAALPQRLRKAQHVFDETGGLHAAGLFAADGRLIDVAEDVGRHNAVDKVIGGRLLRDELPLADRLLCVSGRTSFEIVQKAVVAGVPLVAAVSAPSSLAIDLAKACGVTLVGFVRGDSFNIYTCPERIHAR
jgi:FdhD protein